MHFTLLALATVASFASAQTNSSEIPLGGKCTPGGTPCALGANCYATNSMLQTVCGNFQSSCTSDAQCAFNTCNQGFCNGPLLIAIGKECTPGGTPCALGADCYAVNSMLQTVCGNFQSSCTSDAQCAFNTCNQGFCNGFVASSSAAASSASATITSTPTSPGWRPAPSSTITAPAGSLALGAECNPYVNPGQCANDVQCWASNAGLIARCGNFNAGCKTDAQCAYNSCNNGLCNGFVASSSAGNGTTTTMAAPSASSGPIGNGTVIASKSPSPTTSGSVEFTGAASTDNVAGSFLAIVVGAVALAL